MSSAAISWTSGLAIDADGSPHAYAPGNKGLDYTANAGKSGNWYGLACDKNGTPYIQGPQHPAPGFYISTTALVDHAKAVSDPSRYVDSETVCYISVPRELLGAGVKLGDVCLVEFAGNSTAGVVADVGPKGKYGEGSIALARALGIESSPKHGGVSRGVTFSVWPGSSKGWPRTVVDVTSQVLSLHNPKPA